MSTSTARAAIEILVYLTEQAFDGDPSHSLLANLHELREEDWTAMPERSGRSITDILEHVGWSKWMYENYAFGSASMRGDQPPLIPEGGARSRPHAECLTWLTEGHRRWLASIRALADDSELDRERLTNWGDRLPTRDIIQIMIAHDFYHAGEINHLRALLQSTDLWRTTKHVSCLWYPFFYESRHFHPGASSGSRDRWRARHRAGAPRL